MPFTLAMHSTLSEHTLFCQVRIPACQIRHDFILESLFWLTLFLLAYLLVKLWAGSARVRRGAQRNSLSIPWGRLGDSPPQPAAQRPFLCPEIDLPLSLCLSPRAIKKAAAAAGKAGGHQLAPGGHQPESWAAGRKAAQRTSGVKSLAPCGEPFSFLSKKSVA